jgi:anti-sigma factor RsiW
VNLSHTNLSHSDELLLQRHFDGELSSAEASAFAARLLAEPALQQRAQTLQSLRAGFVGGRTHGPRPRPNFAAGVIAAVRELPRLEQLERAAASASQVRLCQRLLLAAALLATVGFAFAAGLIGDERSDTLQAAPGAATQELDRLDAIARRLPPALSLPARPQPAAAQPAVPQPALPQAR